MTTAQAEHTRQIEAEQKAASCTHANRVYELGNTYCKDCWAWLHAGPVEPKPPALPPTPDEIDAEIAFYENAVKCYETAKKSMDDYEERLITLADKHGFQPDSAPQSTRLAGRRKTITVTRGRTTTLNEPAIQEFMKWCRRRSKMGIFVKLFCSGDEVHAHPGRRWCGQERRASETHAPEGAGDVRPVHRREGQGALRQDRLRRAREAGPQAAGQKGGCGMIYEPWKARNGKTVINEECDCGALRSEHKDNHPIFARGHGSCARTGCNRFTWKGFVFQRKPRGRKAAA